MIQFLKSILTRLSKLLQNLFNHPPERPINQLSVSKQSIEPIIMIPGSSARENRFNRMVAKLNHGQHPHHSLIRIRVWNDGRMTFRGHLHKKDQQPIFVIGFQNNRDGYANIQKQAEFFDLVFNKLYEHYQFKQFSGLGHSNGGLIYTAFLQRYFQKYDGVIIEKLLTIASPYNLNRKNPDKQTDMLKDFLAQQEQLPANLQHLSIIGLFLGETDGIVHKSSVEVGQLIYKGHIHSHQEVVIAGKKAHHSALVQNDEVISLIQEFLFT